MTDTLSTSWEVLEADLVGPLPLSEMGNRYALTVQCVLTKFIDAVPIADKSAISVARALVERIFCRYGTCLKLKTDLGREFMNEFLTEICRMLHISHKPSTPVHHETVGGVERSHRVFNEFLRIHSESKDGAWDTWLSFYVFAYNTTNHVATRYSPYELVFGKLANLPGVPFVPNYSFSDYGTYLNELKNMFNKAHATANENLTKFKQNQNKRMNKTLSPTKFVILSELVLASRTRQRMFHLITTVI